MLRDMLLDDMSDEVELDCALAAFLKQRMRAMMGTVSELVSDRRDQREDAYKLRPRDWVGTATNEAWLPLSTIDHTDGDL